MQIIRRPTQSSVLAAMMFLAAPIFLLNLWVMQKGMPGKLFSSEHRIWIGVDVVWVLITTRWLFKVRRRGFWSVAILAGVMLLGNVHYLTATKNYALAFYALFLLIISGLYLLNLHKLMSNAYYNPGQRWFEGQPRFLPKIEARLYDEKDQILAKLSQLGVEGCYVFAPELVKIQKVDRIELKLGDLSFDCAVELISKTKDGHGRGLRFLAHSADQNKDIRDFIDRVRSSGYVA